ncbi:MULTISPECIES: hypothetical protein [Acinetobacter]|uniref:MotA/TolQ/ExbB proton channel domain-containing protein n=1 Tax=Acinetobacter variabilis TaxID=70346 RepID=A0A7T7WJZ6_9GAMM|nr:MULTISPECIES: hypothetical protein [Acinetobacter]MDM1786633.1 hypothetical protein [Acinetobacter bereziniae]NHB64297.1 hypothetical protein [Acinetobacter sp. GFQ9D191M]NHC00561.1 hypothetical protein [Acinetobacter sp. GFQ9D192M]QQN89121.1 hypothetical protein IAQ69_05530 [Acinetobacter variabilis]
MLNLLHYVAIAVIIGLLFYFISLDKKYQKANPQFPSMLITVGIGFTFLGIAWGLKDFNTEDPTASLGTLVNGIKTAFWGSLAGVIASIIIKIHALIYLKEQEVDKQYDQKIEEFYKNHEDLTKNSSYLEVINNNLNTNNEKLMAVIHSLGVNLETTNKTNMQNVLNSVVKSLDGIEHIQRSTQSLIAGEISELRHEFVQYSQKQAEQNTQIFIEALEGAINRFNESLTNSLGENFKQLNESVNALVEWQDNYAQQVEDQTNNYADMLAQVDLLKSDFATFLEQTDSFGQVVDQLANGLESIDHANSNFNRRIESFYGALDEKVADIEKTRNLLEGGCVKIEEQMTYTMQSTRKIFDGINTYIEESHKNSTQIQNNTTQEVQRLAQQMHTTFDQTQKQLSDSLGIIENKLQHTLNQSLMTLGQQLGSLSTKFANDYEPITVNLKKIIDSLDGGVN